MTTTAIKRGSLFRKYLAVFTSLICSALIIQGATDAWLLYQEQQALLLKVQREQGVAAAGKIAQFIQGIVTEVGWMTYLPSRPETMEQRRFDGLRLLRQVPAITEFSHVDPNGREQLRMSRIALDSVGSGQDVSTEPAFKEAVAGRIHYGPVTFRRDSEPYMTIGLAGARPDAGVTIVDLNLKFIWDVIAAIKVGQSGLAYVTDSQGRLIAHPDISLVLRNSSFSHLEPVKAALAGAGAPSAENGLIADDIDGEKALTSYVAVNPFGWTVFIEAPLAEVYAPLYGSLQRTGLLLLLGLAVSLMAAAFFARRMVGPIESLRAGAARIGDGDLEYRVDVRTGDELEVLGNQFNRMAGEIVEWGEKTKRLDGLKRFLAPQIAQMISSGDESLLTSHRQRITVLFGDLRGFTPFSEMSEPEEVMGVIHEYHSVLGRIIFQYEATVERFLGDGFMAFFNDPVPCPDPERRAVRMAIEMRREMSVLSETWRKRGHRLDFGLGIAEGYATLGRIGFEGRFEYSAIGTVANLASRLCGEAKGGQILISESVFTALGGEIETESLGALTLKGFQRSMPVYNVVAS
jgi:adenylate cyclase